MAAYFMCLNRGKKSVELDFGNDEDRDTILKLSEKADILVENFKVGGLAKRGLGYDDISKVNPKIIYCSITGFGQNGPLSQNAGYDFLIQGMGGLMSVTGTEDSGPMKTGVAVTDVMTGLYSTVGILAALRERETSGKGQHLDLSLFDSQVAMLVNQASQALVTGKAGGLIGNAHPSICPYDALQCKDKQIIIAVGNDYQFSKFCQELGAPELSEDPRFSTNDNRVLNRDELREKLESLLKQKNVDEWVDILGPVGVPAGPINQVREALDHPQAAFRDMVVKMAVPPQKPGEESAEMNVVGTPIKMSRSNTQASTPPPFLGQHTQEALKAWLGE
uniref:CoA transferase n=1 Tax=Paramoeba aestuarina TaxID=180227 RepID=A0A7S4L9W1_9EUKA